MRPIAALALPCLLLAPATVEASPLRGSLLREGKELNFATAHLFATGVRCREPDQKTVSLALRLPAKATRYNLEETIISFSATPGLVKLGDKLVPQTADRSFDPERDRWGRVLAWISRAGRGSEATLPNTGWVRFTALDKMGPIELEFELDFGDLGKVSGTSRVEKTEETVCLIPAPPPPPPAPPKK